MDQHMDSVMVLTSVARIEVMVGRPVLVALHNIISNKVSSTSNHMRTYFSSTSSGSS